MNKWTYVRCGIIHVIVCMQNIPHGFVKKHSMWQYHNALLEYHDGMQFYVNVDLEQHSDRPNSKNHVTMKGGWRDIIDMCDWKPNKMVRFKLIDIVRDENVSVSSRKPILIPLFHMC